jgi:hypothetical protein
MADGTAPKCGRVGSCHIYLKAVQEIERLFCFYPFLADYFCFFIWVL